MNRMHQTEGVIEAIFRGSGVMLCQVVSETNSSKFLDSHL